MSLFWQDVFFHMWTLSYLKVSEYPLKRYRSMLKKTWLCYYIHILSLSLNVLRPTFFNICNLSFLRPPNIGKIGVKIGPKTNYFSYFMSSSTNRIAFFNIFFSLICSLPRDKQNRARDFFFLVNIFWIITFWLFTWKIRFQNSSNYCYKNEQLIIR